jgi:tRNA 2-thiouridine synthesizing protein D
LNFGVMVLEGPYNHQAADSAYHFVNAVIERGHQITGIFFYHDGVINVTKLMDPPQDDRNISRRWSELGAKGIDIVVCIAAAKRRGIVPEVTVPNVRISGLGQLSEIAVNCDRLVTFGD